jgi:hypothetical protein
MQPQNQYTNLVKELTEKKKFGKGLEDYELEDVLGAIANLNQEITLAVYNNFSFSKITGKINLKEKTASDGMMFTTTDGKAKIDIDGKIVWGLQSAYFSTGKKNKTFILSIYLDGQSSSENPSLALYLPVNEITTSLVKPYIDKEGTLSDRFF